MQAFGFCLFFFLKQGFPRAIFLGVDFLSFHSLDKIRASKVTCASTVFALLFTHAFPISVAFKYNEKRQSGIKWTKKMLHS